MDVRVQPSSNHPRRLIRVAATAGAAGLVVLGSAVVLFANDLAVAPNAVVGNATSDSAEVVAVVTGYHAALAVGDSAAALALLASDAIIVESGGVETRDEYRSHHLAGDIGFARVVKGERGPVRVVIQGDVAWATSTSATQGEYRGRQINSVSAELMVLSRSSRGWQIRAIHWSSRARRQ